MLSVSTESHSSTENEQRRLRACVLVCVGMFLCVRLRVRAICVFLSHNLCFSRLTTLSPLPLV